MPNNIPMMPFIFMALILLPLRLSSQQLKSLAFMIWITGGLILTFRGSQFLLSDPSHPNTGLILGAGITALIIGLAKGRFVLSKTSKRNLERLASLTKPQRPIAVYSIRSWIMISVMVGISICLNLSHFPLLWRGAINIGIGAALIMSSFAYLQNRNIEANTSIR